MKSKSIILIAIIIAVAISLFFFLRTVFAGEFIVSPIIFAFGPFEIRWYGVFIALGIVISYLIGRKFAIREGIDEDHIIELVFLGIVFGIIGARLYYVLFNLSYYLKNPLEIMKIWSGGLAIHGAIFFALLVGFVYVRLRKKANMKFLQMTDIFTAMLPFAQALGRWGNFMNYEAYGKPTELPWKMFVPLANRMPGYSQYEYFHPTFLYESLWDFMVFGVLLWFFMKGRKNYGEVTGLYMIIYSIGRFFIEGLRLDSLYIGELRTAQVVSVILIIAGLTIFILARSKGQSVKRVS
ncbi:MAG: prolipoprotein diacylglyceryl transferase [Kosmotogaceae bacterium]